MGGKNHASLHVDGKEIFTVQLDEPGISDVLAPLCTSEQPTGNCQEWGPKDHIAPTVTMSYSWEAFGQHWKAAGGVHDKAE